MGMFSDWLCIHHFSALTFEKSSRSMFYHCLFVHLIIRVLPPKQQQTDRMWAWYGVGCETHRLWFLIVTITAFRRVRLVFPDIAAGEISGAEVLHPVKYTKVGPADKRIDRQISTARPPCLMTLSCTKHWWSGAGLRYEGSPVLSPYLPWRGD